MRIYLAVPLVFAIMACQPPPVASPGFEKMTPEEIAKLDETTVMPTKGSATYSGNFRANYDGSTDDEIVGNIIMGANFETQEISASLNSIHEYGSANNAAGIMEGTGQINGTGFDVDFEGDLTARDSNGNLESTAEHFTGSLEGIFRGDDAKAANGTLSFQAITEGGIDIPDANQEPITGTFSVNK